ncbi:hypothetical protein BN1723_007209 [Verticillium longisporum]|uniref:Uncharacterized protein n=1 Tax=Verticillium longisporum TaxID=100787 RepID=A0A0G4NJU1_VERLO|nr:hypothetical protein BN1723_007209 [Verticillium longisporum]
MPLMPLPCKVPCTCLYVRHARATAQLLPKPRQPILPLLCHLSNNQPPMPMPGSTPGQAPLCPPAHRQSWHSTTRTTQDNHVNQVTQLSLLRDLPSPALVLPTPPPPLLHSSTPSTSLPINRNFTSTGITAGTVPL